MGEEVARSLEDLLSSIDGAPTFGMNARELILQASRRIADQVECDDIKVDLQFQYITYCG